MFSFFKPSLPNIVTVNIDEHNILLANFSRNNNEKKIIINSYQRVNAKDYGIVSNHIFNYKLLSSLINNFVTTNKIRLPFLYICLKSPNLNENITDKVESFNVQNDKFYTNYITIDESAAKKAFYVSQIYYSTLFEYSLLSKFSNLKILKIVPSTISILNILKVFNYDFKKLINFSSLEEDFIKEINSKSLNDFLITNLSLNEEIEKNYIYKCLGLFLSGN